MTRRKTRIGIVCCLLVLMVAAAALTVSVGNAQTAAVPANTAVYRALEHAEIGGIHGRLIGAPREIRGQVMTYEQAHQIKHGRPIDPNESAARHRNMPVWFVVIRGPVLVNVPAAPGVSEQNLIYDQMSITMDARTTELLSISLQPQAHEIDAAPLPALSQTTGPVPPAPTPEYIPLAVPEPTRSPAQTK